MFRRRFLQLPWAVSAVASVAAQLLAADDSDSLFQASRKALFVKTGTDKDEKPIAFLDGTFQVKVSGKDTEGRCVIFDTLRPEKVGPRLHLHNDCDEWFFVRDGNFKFQVGTDFMRLTPGDSLLVPRTVQHAFVKTSEGVARLIIMHQPAGTMEEYFRTAGPIWDRLTPEARTSLAEKHGMRILGPGLTPD
jgi:mannose-6-phosphate isomerase-like protein (cupin superfamily)